MRVKEIITKAELPLKDHMMHNNTCMYLASHCEATLRLQLLTGTNFSEF